MIYLEKGQTNSVILTLSESSQLSDPSYYIFSFENEYNFNSTPIFFTTPDISNHTNRYNQFLISDSNTGSTVSVVNQPLNLLTGQYKYSVYESNYYISGTGGGGTVSVVDFTDSTPNGEPDGIFVIQPDDKTIIYNSGGFSGTGTQLLRINSDGSIDTNFNFIPISDITSISLQSDNKLLLSTQDGPPFLRRLNSDGSIDTSFNSDVFTAYDIYELSDSKIIINEQYINIFRIDSDGLIDTSYGGVYGFVQNNTNEFNSIIKQSDDKILFSLSATASVRAKGGTFSKGPGIHRLNTDGSFDNTFTYNVGGVLIPSIYSILSLDNDGKIIITLVSGTYSYIKRLNIDGSLDNTFNYTLPNNIYFPLSYDFQLDGKIVIGGYGLTEPSIGLIRLNIDGSLDSSFNTNTTNPGGYVKTKQYSNGDMLSIGSSIWPSGNTTITRLDSEGNEKLTIVDIGQSEDLPSLDISRSTGRIIETGRMVVSGNDDNIEDINNSIYI